MSLAAICRTVLVSALVAVALAGCGGGAGGPSAADSRKEIVATLQKGLTTNDPVTICRKSLSSALVVRVYGSHPTKLSYSTWLVLAAFGVKDEPFEKLGGKIVSYRGGLKMGETGEIDVRITTKDGDAAKELLQLYEGPAEDDPFVKELRSTAKAVRDGDDVILTATLTRAMVERLGKMPNK